jgi:20S proteasome alpha/beta subunit
MIAISTYTKIQLLEQSSTPEKIWKIDEHIYVAIAGLNADAMILVNFAR